MKIKIKTWMVYLIVVFALLTLPFVLYGIIVDNFVTSYKLSKESRYSITSSIEMISAGRITSYSYEFPAQNKTYSGSSETIKEGYHYFVRFYPPNPKYNKATEIIATQEDIDKLPADGYLKLPHKQVAGAPETSNFWTSIIVFIVCASIIAYMIYREHKKTVGVR